jgi:phosphate starvation-inducible protein PhoH and related proteins
MGLNAKFVITGDVTQIDLPNRSNSGLIFAMKLLKHIEGISVIQFNKNDIVRHKLVRDIVEAYEKYYEEQAEIKGREKYPDRRKKYSKDDDDHEFMPPKIEDEKDIGDKGQDPQ